MSEMVSDLLQIMNQYLLVYHQMKWFDIQLFLTTVHNIGGKGNNFGLSMILIICKP